MFHPLNAFQYIHHRVVYANRVGVRILHAEKIFHHDVAAESHDLVSDACFEPHDYTYRDNHHGKSYCYTDSSNRYSRAAHLFAVALVAIYSFGYE
jgi:hypothetical protein